MSDFGSPLFERMGSGADSAVPARLFIHGFTQTAASWGAVRAHLSPGREDVAVRVPGHHVAVPVRAIAIDPHADDAFGRLVDYVCSALHASGRRQMHLIGYSLGSRLAMGMLLQAPELFARATLLGGHPGLQAIAERQERSVADARWEKILRGDGISVFLKHWLAQPIFEQLRSVQDAGLQRRLEADIAARAKHDPSELADALAATSLARMPDYRAALAALRMPVCFATGARDAKFAGILQAAQAATPNSLLRLIPGAGHSLPIEAPRAVASLIASHEGAA